MMEFTFEESAWEQTLRGLRTGGCVSAAQFLALMEQEPEEALEDALQLLEDRDILLDISDLPAVTASGDTAVRLRREAQWAKKGLDPKDMEENDPLRLFLEEAIVPHSVDMKALEAKCASGDDAAREALTGMSLGRVVELACEYAGSGVLLMDLIQEGSLGLWRAVCEYQNGDFAALRDRAVRMYMAKTVTLQARESGVGQKMRQALEDYRAVDERLLTELGRNPTMEEIAAELHMTLQEAEVVAQMLDAARTVSRAKAATEEKEETPDDEQAVEDTAYFQMRQRISELLSVLDEKDARLITLRYGLEGGLPLSPEDTGRKLGLTPEEVITAEANALAKLRSN